VNKHLPFRHLSVSSSNLIQQILPRASQTMQRSSSSLKRLGVTASSRKCFSGWPILHATNACTYSSQAFNLPATSLLSIKIQQHIANTMVVVKGVQLSSFGDTSVLDYLEDLPLPPLESASYAPKLRCEFTTHSHPQRRSCESQS